MKKRVVLSIFLFAILVVTLYSIIDDINHENETDGMMQYDDATILYRVKNSETWYEWSHDGLPLRDEVNYINGFRFKLKSKYSGDVVLKTYSSGNWSDICLSNLKCMANGKISAIKLSLIGDISATSTIFYRIKNNEGWSKWYETNMIAGTNENKNYIKDLEVKIIPKNANPATYLKDYNFLGEIVEF